jgi:hypothetical protein
MQLDLSAASAAPAAIARPPTPGAGFSPFDDDISAGPSLELDTVGGGLLARVSSPAIPLAPTSGASLPVPPAPVSQRALMHAAPVIETDPYEAKVLADYGPSPEAFWQAPLYAYRVVTRRSELGRAIVQERDLAKQTAKRVEDALVAFGERARATLKDGPAIDRVRAAEELLRSRDGALAASLDGHNAALAEIDTRLGVAEGDLKRAKDDEARADATREAAEADVQRAEAKLKRIDIEIRNGAAGRGTEREIAASDLAQKTQKRMALDQAHEEARRKTAAAQARHAPVLAERGAQEQRFSRQAGARGAGVDDAQAQMRAALADLGRQLLTDGSVTDLSLARDEVARLEAQAQAKAKSLALHEAALRSYDVGKVLLGAGLVVGAVMLLLLLVFFPFIYRSLTSG